MSKENSAEKEVVIHFGDAFTSIHEGNPTIVILDLGTGETFEAAFVLDYGDKEGLSTSGSLDANCLLNYQENWSLERIINARSVDLGQILPTETRTLLKKLSLDKPRTLIRK